MATTDRPIAYRKFTGQRGTVFSLEQLWAGADHLLLVSTSFAVERYRRFYFQDIEAVIIRPTNNYRNWIIGYSIGLLTCGGIGALVLAENPSSDDAAVGAGVLFALAAAFLIGLVVILVKGPSCKTFLQMRGTLERIGPANHIRSSVRMRARLATLIAAAAEERAVSPVQP